MFTKRINNYTSSLILVVVIIVAIALLWLIQREQQLVTQDETRSLKQELAEMTDQLETLRFENQNLMAIFEADLLKLRIETSDKLAYTEQRITTTAHAIESRLQEVQKDETAIALNTWRSRIAFLRCDFETRFGTPVSNRGSSTLLDLVGTPYLLTNRHVLTEKPTSTLETCRYAFPQDRESVHFGMDNITLHENEDFDFGKVELTSPNEYIRTEVKKPARACAARAEVGDEIVILGFPTNGSETDITVTEGIISGYDDKYYITSAKVETGTSGGAAIHIKNNCYLGIPTFVDKGSLESLARVLDINKIPSI